MTQGRGAQRRRIGSTGKSLGDAIVLVDQGPLCERAAAVCSEAMMRLERARAGWHRFERKDKPAFVRWRAREFGALQSSAREVERQLRDLETLVLEVEMEMRRGFLDPYRAYELVMLRRGKADPGTTEKDRDKAGPANRNQQRLSDFEKEALFQEWIKRSLGTHPDKMDDDAYETSFEAFKSHMFRSGAEEGSPRDFQSIGASHLDEDEADDNLPRDARIKALYRRLVRRLHPDLRADGSANVSALWHEVQEAYAAGDVARLEILLALCDIEARRLSDQSLSQMKTVLAELERSFRALEKSLLEAKGDDAWDFARVGPTAELRTRVERQLKFDLAMRTKRLDLLKRTVAEWAAGPEANKIRFSLA